MPHFSVLAFPRMHHVFCFSTFLRMRHLLFSICALTSLGCVRRWAVEFVYTTFSVSAHAPLSVHCMPTYFSRMCEKMSCGICVYAVFCFCACATFCSLGVHLLLQDVWEVELRRVPAADSVVCPEVSRYFKTIQKLFIAKIVFLKLQCTSEIRVNCFKKENLNGLYVIV
jgi:hypothetical protein